jgi:hypothetical protein
MQRIKEILKQESKALLELFRLINKNKFRIIALFIACIILESSVVSIANLVTVCRAGNLGEYRVKHFALYEKEYEYIAKKCYKLYEDAKTSNDSIERIFIFPSESGSWYVQYMFSDKSKDYTESFLPTEKDISCLVKINKSIPKNNDNTLSHISVNDNSVEFVNYRMGATLYKVKGIFPKVIKPNPVYEYYYLKYFGCSDWYYVIID